MPCESTFHRYVYRRVEQLSAGTAYHFQTRNLRNVFAFQSQPADPVMYVVNEFNDVVAFNDDYSELASEIFYTPAVSAAYRLIIRSFNTSRPGYCDLYRGVNGGAPGLVERDILFFGVTSYRQWNQGDVIQTTNSNGDPYLFVATGNKLYWDDDAGAGLNPRFVAPSAGSGYITLGSYSRTTEGHCDLCIEQDTGLTMSHATVSEDDELDRFTAELQGEKQQLEALEPRKRDKAVAELQKKLLSEHHLALSSASPPQDELKWLVLGPR